ncbi:hypothetical protein [uncultured Akkermansia sp.]|uniref:hypothetical protein n=1 Tax=uncultured Akkermansia sp. TaxID=512294 RepID=UPI0028058A25|nr:hypothetical protein [uncultured Akkermansia sp.]
MTKIRRERRAAKKGAFLLMKEQLAAFPKTGLETFVPPGDTLCRKQDFLRKLSVCMPAEPISFNVCG